MPTENPNDSRLLRRALTLLVPAVLVAGLAVATYLAASGRTEPPAASREMADRALAAARAAQAARWAKPALADAEERLRAAEAELRRQELRLWPLRDFREVRLSYLDAARAADTTRRLALASRSDLEAGALAALRTARCLMTRTEELYLPSRVGGLAAEALRAGKLALREAESLLVFEEFPGARLRADEAAIKTRQTRALLREAYDRFVDPATVRRWREAETSAIERSKRTGAAVIVVNKDRAVLDLYRAGTRVASYPIELGFNALEPKRRSGDRATPEGEYRVSRKRERGQTRYYKALDLDYPNAADLRELARSIELGLLPADARPGGWIEIHGEGGRGWDWTDGCVALRNADMDDLFERVDNGTPVTIIGGNGSSGRFSDLARQLQNGGFEDACARG